MTNTISKTSLTKRRTKADIERLKCELFRIVQADRPMTVRQVFYRMVSEGLIAKKESEYGNVVSRLLTQMRRDDEIPFGWIADNTRWMRKPDSYSDVESFLDIVSRSYRRSLWDSQDAYVEMWLEKDALAGVLMDVTGPWDVPLMVTRGYPSVSFLFEAAEAMSYQRKPAYLYYLGDHDPSGVDIPRFVEQSIRERAPNIDLHFERLAVNEDQIRTYDLLTRPTKKTDSRSKSFEGESVEVDALPPDVLRAIASTAIEQHIDLDRLEWMRAVENEERALIKRMTKLKRGEA